MSFKKRAPRAVKEIRAFAKQAMVSGHTVRDGSVWLMTGTAWTRMVHGIQNSG